MPQRGKLCQLLFMVRNNHLVHRVYACTCIDIHVYTHSHALAYKHTHTPKCKCFSGEVRFQALGILALLSSILHSANRHHETPLSFPPLPRERLEENIAMMLV